MDRENNHAAPAQVWLDAAEKLRTSAEALYRQRATCATTDPKPLSPQATAQLLHELQVHQLELEIQNNELRTAQRALEASQAYYFDFYDLAPVGYCSIGEDGLIRQSNLTTANLLGLPRNQLTHQPFSKFIFKDDQNLFYRFRHNRSLT